MINQVVFRGSTKPIAPWTLDEFKLEKGIDEAMSSLKASGFAIFVVTNQPDISKGYITQDTLSAFHNTIRERFPIQEISICYHVDSDNCSCRKPKPGMLLELRDKYDIKMDSSYMVGDSWKDIAAGEAAGCNSILLRRSYNQGVHAGRIIDTISDLPKTIECMEATIKPR